MDDFISRQAMIMDLKTKQESMKEMQLHNNAKIAERMIGYVEGFPAAKKPTEKQACWMFKGTDPNNVFLVEMWCPMCGEMAMYPEDEDRPLDTPFCAHCGVPMDDSVPWDPSWPYYHLPKKRMKSQTNTGR